MVSAVIVSVLLFLLAFLFLIACIGEKVFQNKVLYATVALVLVILMLSRL